MARGNGIEQSQAQVTTRSSTSQITVGPEWLAEGYIRNEALEWLQAGIASPLEANEWKHHGHGPDFAGACKARGLDPHRADIEALYGEGYTEW